MLPLRFQRFWLAGGACLLALVVAAGLAPARDLPRTGLGDLPEHGAAFLALTLWFSALARRSLWPLVGVALVLLGAALEWLQGAMSLGRVADRADLAANALGIGVGLALASAGLGGWMGWIEARIPRR